MQALSFKYVERRNDWRCCFCCHVRTATISLGVWHLMIHVIGVLVIAVALRNPNLMYEQQPIDPSSTSPPPFQSNSKSINQLIHHEDAKVGVFVTFLSFLITFLMVYGAIKGRPSYLMPFFCIQIFDFCITSFTALSWLCYLPNMHQYIETSSNSVPLHSELLALSPQALSVIFVVAFTAVIFLKGYLLGVVWSCYRYLTLRLVSGERTIHLIEPHHHHHQQQEGQRRVLLNPEPYHKFPTPPPSYADATASPQHVP